MNFFQLCPARLNTVILRGLPGSKIGEAFMAISVTQKLALSAPYSKFNKNVNDVAAKERDIFTFGEAKRICFIVNG